MGGGGVGKRAIAPSQCSSSQVKILIFTVKVVLSDSEGNLASPRNPSFHAPTGTTENQLELKMSIFNHVSHYKNAFKVTLGSVSLWLFCKQIAQFSG